MPRMQQSGGETVGLRPHSGLQYGDPDYDEYDAAYMEAAMGLEDLPPDDTGLRQHLRDVAEDLWIERRADDERNEAQRRHIEAQRTHLEAQRPRRLDHRHMPPANLRMTIAIHSVAAARRRRQQENARPRDAGPEIDYHSALMNDWPLEAGNAIEPRHYGDDFLPQHLANDYFHADGHAMARGGYLNPVRPYHVMNDYFPQTGAATEAGHHSNQAVPYQFTDHRFQGSAITMSAGYPVTTALPYRVQADNELRRDPHTTYVPTIDPAQRNARNQATHPTNPRGQ
ncbi:MAG: hypothetical protein Q9174_004243 [Haloplaca sp. 1 TL-2023]